MWAALTHGFHGFSDCFWSASPNRWCPPALNYEVVLFLPLSSTSISQPENAATLWSYGSSFILSVSIMAGKCVHQQAWLHFLEKVISFSGKTLLRCYCPTSLSPFLTSPMIHLVQPLTLMSRPKCFSTLGKNIDDSCGWRCQVQLVELHKTAHWVYFFNYYIGKKIFEYALIKKLKWRPVKPLGHKVSCLLLCLAKSGLNAFEFWLIEECWWEKTRLCFKQTGDVFMDTSMVQQTRPDLICQHKTSFHNK